MIRLGHRQAAGDFLAQALPEWMLDLERSASQSLIRGTQEGIMAARGLAFEGYDTGQ